VSAEPLLAALRTGGLSLAVAESLTGGALAARIVAEPGASAVFRGGWVSYATEAKASMLGVDAALLAGAGPVDAQVAIQMADSARRQLQVDLALATTGVAGPTPQHGQPVGTVFVAAALAGTPTRVRGYRLAGSRGQISHVTIELALSLGSATLSG